MPQITSRIITKWTALRADPVPGSTSYDPTVVWVPPSSDPYAAPPQWNPGGSGGTASATTRLIPQGLVVTDFGNIKTLLHFDGGNGGPIVDETGRAWTGSGAVITTADAKFGSGSCDTIPSTYIRTGTSSDFAFGTGDFTVEFWIKPDWMGLHPEHPFFDTGAMSISLMTGGYPHEDDTFRIKIDGEYGYPMSITDNFAWPSNGWEHVAVVRNTGVMKVFVGGILRTLAADDFGSYDVGAPTREVCLGSGGGT
jgi:hypothetical protein